MDFVIVAGLLALLQSPVGFLVFAALLGLMPAVIAWRKGRSFWLFWLYGTVVLLVALPHAIVMRPDTKRLEVRLLAGCEHRRCPHCAEIIRREATACRHCGRESEDRYKLKKTA